MPNHLQQQPVSPSTGRRLAAEAARTPTACIVCRERKIKCSGNQPCRFCLKRDLQCVMPETGRRKLYSVKYVKELERRVAMQDGSILSRAPEGESSVTDAPEIRVEGVNRTDSAISPIETNTVMSSSQNFGSHIKAMQTRPDLHSKPRKVIMSKSADNAYGIEVPSLRQHNTSFVSNWPTEDEAQNLLDIVLSSVGRIQHLFDPRTFADQLALRYTEDRLQIGESDLWHVEMLMVFAIGKLLRGNLDDDTQLPGENFFKEAMNNLPNLTHVYAAGTLGVEVMSLVAFYLQNADLKESAHIYAGMALRMALLTGLHTETSTPMTRSEKTHRNRLWWSVYMQERRLSAATGMPLSIHDDAIHTQLPTNTPGFYPSESIKVNIEIAKITGQILHTIYGQTEQTEHTFVTGVKQIISSLYQISHNIPSELAVDFSKKRPEVSRSSATLYLMLYQAMILATRPILLHLARERFMTSKEATIRPNPLQKLTETCVDAARRSLLILCALKRQSIIAKFGFFDLDALFSVSFVLILTESIRTDPQNQSRIRDIISCMEIFAYLKQHGNKAAHNRELDIMQICDHLGLSKELLYPASIEPATNYTSNSAAVVGQSNYPALLNESLENLTTNNYNGPTNNQQCVMDLSEASPTAELANLEHPLHWVDDPTTNEFMVNEETRDLYSFYYNDGLALSGTVETDWGVLERQIFPST